MKKNAARFLDDECGATAVEYALVVTLIAAIVIVGVTATGTQVLNLYTDVAAKLINAINVGG